MTTIVSDIIKIVTPDDDEVFDKDEIGDFISQISKEDYEVITTELGRLNDIGVKDKVPVKCVNCESEFDLTLDFNPTTFFRRKLVTRPHEVFSYFENYKEYKESVTGLISYVVVNSNISWEDAWMLSPLEISSLNNQIKERLELDMKMLGVKRAGF